MENMVGLVTFLRKWTKVPVPQFFDYDTTFNNPIGSPYVIMQGVQGKPLSKYYVTDELDDDEKGIFMTKTVFQLNKCVWELAKVGPFNSIGTPVFRDGAFLGMDSIYRSSETVVDGFNSVKDHLMHQSEFDEVGRGPTCEGIYLRHFLQWTCEMMEQVQKTTSGFRLFHPDLNVSNIMVDDDGNITALIDWDFVQTGSACLSVGSYPRFLCTDWYTFTHGEWNRLQAKNDPSRCCGGIGDPRGPSQACMQLQSSHKFWDRLRRIWTACNSAQIQGSSYASLPSLDHETAARMWKATESITSKDQTPASFSPLQIQDMAHAMFIPADEGKVSHILAKIVMDDRESKASHPVAKGLPDVHNLLYTVHTGTISPWHMSVVKANFMKMLYAPFSSSTASIYSSSDSQHPKIKEGLDYLAQYLQHGGRKHELRYALDRHTASLVVNPKYAPRPIKFKVSSATPSALPQKDNGGAGDLAAVPKQHLGVQNNQRGRIPKDFMINNKYDSSLARGLRSGLPGPMNLVEDARKRMNAFMNGDRPKKMKNSEAEVVMDYMCAMMKAVLHIKGVQVDIFGKVVFDAKAPNSRGDPQLACKPQSDELASANDSTISFEDEESEEELSEDGESPAEDDEAGLSHTSGIVKDDLRENVGTTPGISAFEEHPDTEDAQAQFTHPSLAQVSTSEQSEEESLTDIATYTYPASDTGSDKPLEPSSSDEERTASDNDSSSQYLSTPHTSPQHSPTEAVFLWKLHGLGEDFEPVIQGLEDYINKDEESEEETAGGEMLEEAETSDEEEMFEEEETLDEETLEAETLEEESLEEETPDEMTPEEEAPKDDTPCPPYDNVNNFKKLTRLLDGCEVPLEPNLNEVASCPGHIQRGGSGYEVHLLPRIPAAARASESADEAPNSTSRATNDASTQTEALTSTTDSKAPEPAAVEPIKSPPAATAPLKKSPLDQLMRRPTLANGIIEPPPAQVAAGIVTPTTAARNDTIDHHYPPSPEVPPRRRGFWGRIWDALSTAAEQMDIVVYDYAERPPVQPML